jgi:hypothetical protein
MSIVTGDRIERLTSSLALDSMLTLLVYVSPVCTKGCILMRKRRDKTQRYDKRRFALDANERLLSERCVSGW